MWGIDIINITVMVFNKVVEAGACTFVATHKYQYGIAVLKIGFLPDIFDISQ